jgi:class 3 adenylate cyclase
MDGRLLDELLPSTVVGTITVCLGLVLLLTQTRTTATVGLTLAWVWGGAALVFLPVYVHHVDARHVPVAARLVGLLLVADLASSSLYLTGLLRTARRSRRADLVVRTTVMLGYALAGVLVVLMVTLTADGLDDYGFSLGEPGVFGRPGFWVFATFWIVVAAVYVVGWSVLARQSLDVGERARANASAVAVPLVVVSTVLPYRAAVWVFAAAVVILLHGLFRFHAAQGERAAFLSRFLSPHVAEQVRHNGLTSVMAPGELDLTVVACDLRGFTAYAEGVPSQAVIDLLNEYYEAVGSAVAEVDGTVKDYAGDGILVLVGAPLPRPDHAAAGLRLAQRIHEVTRPVIERWSTGPHPLGVGVGAASGRVTVGAIGSDARMEYTAVGTPVNLAARLCAAAAPGETLVDQRTASLGEGAGLEPRPPMRLKGFGAEVAVFATSAPTRWVG